MTNRVRVFNDFTFPRELGSMHLDLTPENATLSIAAHGDLPYRETTLNWAELDARNDRSGFDRWVVGLASDGTFQPPFNIYERTTASKLIPADYAAMMRQWLILHAFIRPDNADWMSCQFFVFVPIGVQFSTNGNREDEIRTLTTGQKTYMPLLDLQSGPTDQTGTTITVTIASGGDAELYMKSDKGFVPAKIQTVNGQASFKFVPLAMASGDVATIKVGFRYFSNLKSIQVVAP